MPSHNPECTHGGPHAPEECRDRYARRLKPIEDPISVPEASNPVLVGSELTDADREALRAALAGLEPITETGARPERFPPYRPVAVQNLAGADHDPYRDPDADADAAQRSE